MQLAKNRVMFGAIVLMTCMLGIEEVSGVDTSQYEGQNWYRMATLRYKLKNDFYLFAVEAERSKEAALASGNCDSINYARFADMLNKISRNNPWELDTELAAVDCEWEGSPLFHLAALEAFQRSDFKQAEELFRQAVEFGKTEIYMTENGAREGLAAALANQHRYQEALDCLIQIHEKDPENTQPNTLNNFAYFSFATGKCEEAVTWAELALERLNVIKGKEPNFDLQHAGQWNVSYLNLMQAAMGMGDRQLAGKALAGINLKHYFDDRDYPAVAILTSYCQWINNPELFGLLRPDLMKLLNDAREEDFARVLGINASLFAKNDSLQWRDIWDECRMVPVIYRGGILDQCPSGEQVKLGEATATKMPYRGLSIAGGCSGLLMLLVFLRQRRILSRLRELKLESRGVWQSIVEDQLAKKSRPSQLSNSIPQKRALAAFNMLLHSVPSRGLVNMPGWNDWSELEKQVASGLVLGERTKAIAARLDISLNQVYTTRKSIRERLGLSEDETLEKWLKSKAE